MCSGLDTEYQSLSVGMKSKMLTEKNIKSRERYSKKPGCLASVDIKGKQGVTTHLEPDILECEVKWALGSISMNTVSASDGIPAELSKI